MINCLMSLLKHRNDKLFNVFIINIEMKLFNVFIINIEMINCLMSLL